MFRWSAIAIVAAAMRLRAYPQLVLMSAGLLGWALGCAAGVSALAERGALRLPWLVAQVVFVLGFLLNTWRPLALSRGGVEQAALLVQLSSALYVAASVEPRLSLYLFVIMAGQAAFSFAPWSASAFVVIQTLAVGVVWWRR